jgi:hypothetical protein
MEFQNHIQDKNYKNFLKKNSVEQQAIWPTPEKKFTPIKLKEILFSGYHARSFWYFWNYSQTCIKRSLLGQRKSGLIR